MDSHSLMTQWLLNISQATTSSVQMEIRCCFDEQNNDLTALVSLTFSFTPPVSLVPATTKRIELVTHKPINLLP